jgi:hypothetical protein
MLTIAKIIGLVSFVFEWLESSLSGRLTEFLSRAFRDNQMKRKMKQCLMANPGANETVRSPSANDRSAVRG